jgi:hypothetical protein
MCPPENYIGELRKELETLEFKISASEVQGHPTELVNFYKRKVKLYEDEIRFFEELEKIRSGEK